MNFFGIPRSNELTKLWNLCPDNLEACKGKERDFLPTLENYFKDAIEQIDANEPSKEEINLLKDGNFGWRALRLLARRSPHFFTFSTVLLNQQSSYLEMMVRKIAAEQKVNLETIHPDLVSNFEDPATPHFWVLGNCFFVETIHSNLYRVSL